MQADRVCRGRAGPVVVVSEEQAWLGLDTGPGGSSGLVDTGRQRLRGVFVGSVESLVFKFWVFLP